jgi:hypothetical protein
MELGSEDANSIPALDNSRPRDLAIAPSAADHPWKIATNEDVLK